MTGDESREPSRDTVVRVAGRFGLTPASVLAAPGGHINESFFVDATEGAFVVQRINRRIFPDPDAIMANHLVVHRFLVGDLVPAPVPATDGTWLVHDGPDLWRALVRVPGGVLPGAASLDAVGAAGELLGRFHSRVAGLDPRQLVVTLPRFHDLRRRLDDFRAVASDDPHGRAAGCAHEIELALGAAPLVETTEDLDTRAPLRVVHNDAKLDNFVFRDGRAVSIVDLDTLMPGRWLWDVGDLLRSAATAAAEDERDLSQVFVDPERYQSVVDGYRRGVVDAATEGEIEALDVAGAISTYEQALRFLADWLAGDVYFRVSRPGHNLDRARAQLRLLGSMPHSPL